MARAYSDDLRGKVLDAMASGLSTHQAASRFGIGVATSVRWARRLRDHGETSPRCSGGRRGSRLDGHAAFVEGLIEDEKDITLDEMVARLADERDLRVGRSTLSDWLRARGWTFKKRPRTHWSRTARTF